MLRLFFFGPRKLPQDTEREKEFSEATDRGCRHALIRFVAVLAAVAFLAQDAAAQGTWTTTGSMAAARRDHTATLLTNGKVLIARGTGGSTELYDRGTGTFSPTGGPLAGGFSQGATATRLLDSRVLVVGGNAEIYDPSSGTFSLAGTLNVSRVAHTATLLPDGKVLIAGGQDGSATETHASAELFDPTTNTFTLTGNLTTDRSSHTAVLLPNGKVLVGGGDQITTPGFSTSLSSAELFDPMSRTFNPTGNMTQPRCCLNWTQAQILGNGKVLVMGGSPALSGELFDPATGTFSATGTLNTPRGAMSATLLSDGQVLIAGGSIVLSGGFSGTTDSAEMYNPATNAFTPIASMNQARQQHTATLLSNDQVLVTGGVDFGVNADLNSAELFSSIVTVVIDIKPGTFPNSISPRSRGKLPVAILTTATFDATTVDATTVLFGRTGIEAAQVQAALEDVNGDGKLDLVLLFNTQATGIPCGDNSAILTGTTRSEQAIKGSDSIQTVGCK
jgi:Galactose oxidase, central domain/Kelch motif